MLKSIILAMIIVMSAATANAQNTIYNFTVKDIAGNDFAFSQLKGKKILVVNTASKCGLTPQYEGLEELYQQYGGDDFVIVGFPANNFKNQEPGTNEEIAQFCKLNYGVTFPMMGKISVKGDDIHPLYKWLTTESLNGVEDSKVKWNFQKYMINENGELVGHLAPTKKPDSKELLTWLED